MKKHAAILVAAIALLSGFSAQAREPFEDEWRPFPPPVAPAPDPVAFVVPAGLYYVTDTYVGDVVATHDATTTYSTTTVHESTGTYARVIDTVDTAATSAFDGLAFNGRGALTDGRALAGTYYENFVLTAAGYVPVSIVFFQDDSETRRRESASSPSPVPTAPTTTTATAPVTTSALAVASAASRSVVAPTPSFRPETPIAPAGPTLRAGIALASDGPTLASAEVLRGRLIHFWPRAFANDVAVPIRSWRLLSARPDHISASSGSIEPLAAQWIQMPAPGLRWSLGFEIVTELAPTERLEAQISITVSLARAHRLIARRSLLVLALIAGSIAGALYFIGAQRVPMVVAAQDVAVIRPLTAQDLAVRSVPPDALPAGAISSVDDAIGRVPITPLWQGQPLVVQALADDAAVFHTGLTLRPGERAIAIPVVAVSAVGGAISPGARVDVLAVPLIGRAPAGRTVELLVADALVLDVRAESGAPYVPRPRDSALAVDRIASVIIAISPSDEIRFADRIATSTFVLAFSSAH